jgi:hypothetical protein
VAAQARQANVDMLAQAQQEYELQQHQLQVAAQQHQQNLAVYQQKKEELDQQQQQQLRQQKQLEQQKQQQIKQQYLEQQQQQQQQQQGGKVRSLSPLQFYHPSPIGTGIPGTGTSDPKHLEQPRRSNTPHPPPLPPPQHSPIPMKHRTNNEDLHQPLQQ